MHPLYYCIHYKLYKTTNYTKNSTTHYNFTHHESDKNHITYTYSTLLHTIPRQMKQTVFNNYKYITHIKTHTNATLVHETLTHYCSHYIPEHQVEQATTHSINTSEASLRHIVAP